MRVLITGIGKTDSAGNLMGGPKMFRVGPILPEKNGPGDNFFPVNILGLSVPCISPDSEEVGSDHMYVNKCMTSRIANSVPFS